MLETSSGIFTVLETSSGDFYGAGDFFGRIFKVLETSGIFTVLETSLEGFSRCWRLLWRDFHGARDDFLDSHSA